MKSIILLSLLFGLLFSKKSSAENVRIGEENLQFPAIGSHYPILLITLGSNPENKIVAYAQLSDDCEVVLDGFNNRPFIGFYWLMKGEAYKPLQPFLEKNFFRNKFSTVKNLQDAKTFSIDLPDLLRLANDLPYKGIKVVSEKMGSHCFARAILQMGPSQQNQILHVQSMLIKTSWLLTISGMQFIGLDPKGNSMSLLFGTL